MKKGNIILDFDNTIFLSSNVLVDYINQRWEINAKESDFTSDNKLHEVVQKYTGDFSITYEKVYVDYRENCMLSQEWQNKIIPIPDACEVILDLSREYSLFIATKRIDNSEALVRGIVDKYLPGCIQNIYFAIKYINGSRYLELPKRYFITILSGKNIAFIDDSKNEIEEVRDIVPSYLFDPNNKHGIIEGISKVKGWKEIGSIFL